MAPWFGTRKTRFRFSKIGNKRNSTTSWATQPCASSQFISSCQQILFPLPPPLHRPRRPSSGKKLKIKKFTKLQLSIWEMIVPVVEFISVEKQEKLVRSVRLPDPCSDAHASPCSQFSLLEISMLINWKRATIGWYLVLHCSLRCFTGITFCFGEVEFLLSCGQCWQF